MTIVLAFALFSPWGGRGFGWRSNFPYSEMVIVGFVELVDSFGDWRACVRSETQYAFALEFLAKFATQATGTVTSFNMASSNFQCQYAMCDTNQAWPVMDLFPQQTEDAALSGALSWLL